MLDFSQVTEHFSPHFYNGDFFLGYGHPEPPIRPHQINFMDDGFSQEKMERAKKRFFFQTKKRNTDLIFQTGGGGEGVSKQKWSGEI